MSWKKIKLSEFLKNRDGRYKPNDIAISDFKRIDKIDFSGNLFISEKASNTDMILVKKGDLVISGINIEKGAMTVYEGDNDITATIHYSSYIYDKEKIDIEFLKYFLKSSEFKQAIKEQVPGGIKTEIKPKHLLPLEVFIPTTIEEQKIVVENLKLIEKENLRLATEINTQLNLVKQLRQSFLREAMQGKLVAQKPSDGNAKDLLEKIKAEKTKSGKKEKLHTLIKKEEIPFEIPENWIWCRLNQICLKITDGTHFSPPNTEYGNYKYITAKNIKEIGIDLSKISYVTDDIHKEIYSRCNPEYGDVLYIKDGATTGIVTLNNLKEEFSMLSSVALIKTSDDINNKFLLYMMRSPFYYNATRDDMSGVAITRVTLDKIQKTLTPLPPLSEQQRIVEKLDELMRMCDELEQSIKASQGQNEKLLQQVLREALRG